MGSSVSVIIANLYMEVFEEQAVESAPYKRNIWKGYVDDTFTILGRSNVNSSYTISTVNSPPSALPWKPRKTSWSPFLTHQFRESSTAASHCLQKTTDQSLTYDSHHHQSVKRSIVNCLYNRAKRLVTEQSVSFAVCQRNENLLAAAYSNKAFAPSLSPTWHLGHI